MSNSLLLYTENSCPTVHMFRKSDAVISVSTKEVEYTCHVGHRFPDGYRSKTFNCEDDISTNEDAKCLGRQPFIHDSVCNVGSTNQKHAVEVCNFKLIK